MSLGADTVVERGMCSVVGEVHGLEGLGHLEEGSGQTGLLGWTEGPCGRGFSFEAELGSTGGADGVRALR